MYSLSKCFVSILFIPTFILFTSSLQAVQIQFDSAAEGGAGAFSGLLLEGSGNPDVGIILMHGRTSTPDGPVVRQLRNALNSAGYTTLSIDNPYSAVDANMNGNFRDFNDYVSDVNGVNFAFPESYARIRTAINHLQSLSIDKVVLVGFSMGSRFTSAHFANGQRPGNLTLSGYIGIGMYATSIGPLNHTNNMPAITVPVLDIYGDDDTNAVNTASARSTAYAGTSYTTSVLDCDSDLMTNDCHKLLRLKSTNGEICKELEFSAINWITSTVPLSTSQGLGICENVTAPVSAPATNSDGGGGGTLYLLALIFPLVQRKKLIRAVILI